MPTKQRVFGRKVARFEVYQQRGGRRGFRWRLRKLNGRIIAASGESFTRRAGAVRAVKTVAAAFLGQGLSMDRPTLGRNWRRVLALRGILVEGAREPRR